MLAYRAAYADRTIGGVCEHFELSEAGGVQTITIITVRWGRHEVVSATAGSWEFFAGGERVLFADLDNPFVPMTIGQKHPHHG